MAYKDVFMLRYVPLNLMLFLSSFVFRDNEIIECFKKARAIGAIGQVRLDHKRMLDKTPLLTSLAR